MRRLLCLLGCLVSPVVLGGPAPRPGAGALSLFDGATLAGWEGNAKLWRVQDGALTGGSLTEKVAHNDFLCTTREFGDFVLALKFKLSGDPRTGLINSGIQVRSRRVAGSPEVAGYQCDIGDPAWWGAIYDEARRNRLLVESDMAALGPVLRRGDWNDYVIRAQGARLTCWINGVQTAEWIENDPSVARRGVIGIQVHGGGCSLIQVKDVMLEELAPAAEFVGAPAPGPAPGPSPLAADVQRGTFSLPPGFEIELVAAEDAESGKFVGLQFDQRGRMWSMTAFEYPVDGNENPAAAKALYAGRGRDKVLVWDTPFAGGLQHPRVFADGLAIPLGLLPYQDGAFVQHGPDIKLLRDTDGDGRADKLEVVLSGFGVQDSHLFPHQFTRAPGGWIWMAQGAFNFGKVRTTTGAEQQFDRTRMARFRPDGSAFDIITQGPCNIWGLVLDGDGRAWIQEANDYGYPAMPLHAYANYPGCSDALIKSYAPIFPGSAPDFRMGGTGLSGLALADRTGAWPAPYAGVMYVANPITRKIQALRIHPDGPRDRLELLPDFIQSSDEWFRPVAIQFGPDGCLYIVDWYNKIISHNEVPRNHPDRDKTRGRIWRVRATAQKPFPVPDFTRLDGPGLLARLGGDSLAQSHLAWQAIVDRKMVELVPQLAGMVADKQAPLARRVAALWALEGLGGATTGRLRPLLDEPDRNLRREAVRALAGGTRPAGEVLPLLAALIDDADPEVRAEVIRTASGWLVSESEAVGMLVRMARPSLDGPVAPSTQNARKTIKVGVAYEREFERYLVRMFLEGQPAATAAWLDSPAAAQFPGEQRMLAALALPAQDTAPRIATLLGQLGRAPNQEELLRMLEAPEAPGVAAALRAVLQNPASRQGALEKLLAVQTRIEARKLAPVLGGSARELLAGGAQDQELGLRLVETFKLREVEPQLLAMLDAPGVAASQRRVVVRTLAGLGGDPVGRFVELAKRTGDEDLRAELLGALAGMNRAEAASAVLEGWAGIAPAQRRALLDRLAGQRAGAAALVSAVAGGVVGAGELDGVVVERLQAVLPGDAGVAGLLDRLGELARPVLALDGGKAAWSATDLAVDGPFTLESWVWLEPGISNEDGLLGVPGELSINYYQGLLRVWAGPKLRDVIIARKPAVAGLWTHVAVTREVDGSWRIYQDGELDQAESRPAPQKFAKLRIGWALDGRGTAGRLAELRIWNRALTAEEIRAGYDRRLGAAGKPDGLLFAAGGAEGWGQLQAGARVVRTTDLPPVLSEAQAKELDAKFAKFRALASEGGDAGRGKVVAGVCRACHLIGGEGGNLAPDLSGAGAMGTEALLRNILTPNAAMENGYRTYQVQLRAGELVEGLFVSEDAKAVVVRIPNGGERRIERGDILRSNFLRRSLMPEGLLDGMTQEQVRDLFAYLRGLR